MRFLQRAAVAATITALALLGGLSVTSPAQAAPTSTAQAAAFAPPGSCANNSVCGYGDSQFRSGQGYEYVTGSAGSCQNVGLNDQWTSVYNNAGRTVRLYRDANCGNGVWTLTNGDSLRNMSLYQPSWNNKISSVRMS